MTNTPTPPAMTPEQRAVLVAELRLPWFTNGCEWYQVRAANSLEADGVTIATLTAERDAAQAEIARLTAALATAREDGMREAANSVLQAAGQEYVLVHTSENEDARMGRHSAVRGMMVRMGIYAELEDAIDDAITKGAAT